MMRVGDRDRERIGGVGAGDLHAGQQPRDHRMDLRLFRAAGADHRLLDQAGGIFADLDPGARRAHQHDAARLAELERRLRVLVDEHFLDRGGVGPCSAISASSWSASRASRCGQRRRGIGLDLAVGDMRQAVALGLDQPPAGGAESGIEAEDPQPSFSSSSSGTS